MLPSTINGLNGLPLEEKRKVFQKLVPIEILELFQISPDLYDEQGRDLFVLRSTPGKSDVEVELYHQYGFQDPITYGHLSDTITGKLHILLYVMNDPNSPRFDIDRMPDGMSTKLGADMRNLEAEKAAMNAGLSPGQIRKGLHRVGEGIRAFEELVSSLGHDLYFVEPLYYHNAIIFERYGFAYQQGRSLMERIHVGFQPGGDLHARLDGSSPFRTHEAAKSIRLRSWAVHDGILGEHYDNVTMYKQIGLNSNLNTSGDTPW